MILAWLFVKAYVNCDHARGYVFTAYYCYRVEGFDSKFPSVTINLEISTCITGHMLQDNIAAIKQFKIRTFSNYGVASPSPAIGGLNVLPS